MGEVKWIDAGSYNRVDADGFIYPAYRVTHYAEENTIMKNQSVFKHQVPSLYLWYDKDCGLGHKLRCQTLGNEWLRRGGAVHFSGEPTTPAVVVFDNYNKPDTDREKWGRANLVVNIEDRPLVDVITCDILLNQNYGAEQLRYNTTGRVLLGAQYFMLRGDYLALDVSETRDVFDADAQSRNLEAGKFARAMASARVIVCSAGCTAHEALYLKKPALLRLSAPNQSVAYENLIADGYALPENSDSEGRARSDKAYISKVKNQNIIDGKGVERVVDAILEEWEKKAWLRND